MTLKIEYENLHRNYLKTDGFLAQQAYDFFASGGVCCPSCGVPGYAELCSKQERREARMQQIREKIQRNFPGPPPPPFHPT